MKRLLNITSFLMGMAMLTSSMASDTHCRSYFKPRDLVNNKVYHNTLEKYHQTYYLSSAINLGQNNRNYEEMHLGKKNPNCEEINDQASWLTWKSNMIFQKSWNRESLAKTFLPYGKKQIVVDEQGLGDVNSQWFNLLAPAGTYYKSIFSVKPDRFVWGWAQNLYMNLDRWVKGLWTEIDFVIVYARNSLHIKENVLIPSQTNVKNLKEALSDPLLQYSRLSQSRDKLSVDDLRATVGYDWIYQGHNRGGLYGIITAPTNAHIDNHYLFEAQTNSNHWSLGMGAQATYKFWTSETWSATFLTDFEYRFVMPAKERRTFDLTNGPWTRYLLVVKDPFLLEATPAAPYLTHKVQVTPGSVIDWWSAFHFQKNHWGLEIGYDFYFRDEEHIDKDDIKILDNLGIYDIGAIIPTSASTATIQQGALSAGTFNPVQSDSVFTPIAKNNYNLHSGKARTAISHTLFGAFSYTDIVRGHEYLLSLGLHGEFANTKGALSNWGLFMNSSISF